jgi:hypothetical protein
MNCRIPNNLVICYVLVLSFSFNVALVAQYSLILTQE